MQIELTEITKALALEGQVEAPDPEPDADCRRSGIRRLGEGFGAEPRQVVDRQEGRPRRSYVDASRSGVDNGGNRGLCGRG